MALLPKRTTPSGSSAGGDAPAPTGATAGQPDDSWSGFDTEPEAAGAVGATSAGTPARPRRAKKAAAERRPGDPVVQGLIITILAVIALTLVTIVYALVTGVFGNGAPRTAGEQRIMAAKAKIDAGSTEAAAWDTYIRALIDDGQYGKAQDTITEGAKTVKNLDISADMTYMQAELYLAQGKLDDALATADEALATIKMTYEAGKAAAEQSGQPNAASAAGIHANYWELLLLKSEVFEKQQKWAEALPVYDEYLAGNPTAASVFTQRGKVKEQLGDTAGAEADYRQTLAYISDDAEALAGLERIGASR